MTELRRIRLSGRDWIVFRDVCDSLGIEHEHLAIDKVPMANRMQSIYTNPDGTKQQVWFVDDVGAHELGAAVTAPPQPKKRTRKPYVKRKRRGV
ncbi:MULTISPECIES: hypothetical protein [unclassified Streptomyces]|uniref:hypothetical protein n=1 Tax=unclassified Streptomyces TaxID=2593676 RepID=UPI0036E6C019